MSVDSGLSIRLEAIEASGSNHALVLKELVDFGWSAVDHGQVVYLPLHDGGRYDWTHCAPGDASVAWDTIRRKAEGSERLGLMLMWGATNVGGPFLVEADLTVLVSFSSERRETGPGVTDVTWYLERIVPALRRRWTIRSISWSEA